MISAGLAHNLLQPFSGPSKSAALLSVEGCIRLKCMVYHVRGLFSARMLDVSPAAIQLTAGPLRSPKWGGCQWLEVCSSQSQATDCCRLDL